MTNSLADQRSLLHLALRAEWASAEARHVDVRHFEKFNVWRDLDLLPPALQGDIPGQGVGRRESRPFSAGESVPPWSAANVYAIQDHQFNRQFRPGVEITPRLGRFYPQAMVRGAARGFDEARMPMRLVGIEGERLTFDLNHPMAGVDMSLGVEVVDISPAPAEHGGRCTDALHELMQGPGIQARYRGRPTDFLSGEALRIASEIADRAFYAMPRLVNHLDARALAEVTGLYRALLPAGSRVLDLMASWNSHLPEDLELPGVVGLGLNREELEANPRLDERLDHDLNETAELPFADASFDAVVCTASVEYLRDPVEVFREVRRILRPGGVFANSFSNRWFPGRAIALWPDLHEFERMGLVSEYFLRAGGFEDLNTLSVRGLMRPDDDPHIGSTLWSDPVYAVWGFRSSTS